MRHERCMNVHEHLWCFVHEASMLHQRVLSCVFVDASFPLLRFFLFCFVTYVFSLFLEVSHGAAALTHFSLTHIAATLLTHSTAVVLTHNIAILIALPHWCSIYSGQSCRLFFS